MTDWEAVAELLYQRVKNIACTCEYARTGPGVPTWFPDIATGGIGRKLVKRCARHEAMNVYERAAGLELTQ